MALTARTRDADIGAGAGASHRTQNIADAQIGPSRASCQGFSSRCFSSRYALKGNIKPLTLLVPSESLE